MKEKILCECTKCGKAFIVTNADGLCCDECKGLLKPIDSVKNMKENLKAMQDKLDKATELTKKKESHTLTIKLDLDTMAALKETAKAMRFIVEQLKGMAEGNDKFL